MPPDAYSIGDLARLTGLSVRTIRYYLAQGLIPASGESGPGAHYGEAHLGRLRLVRRLQQQHLPLAEIRARLAALTDAQVVDLAAEQGTATATEPETTALDYVRAVLAGSERPSASPAPLAAMPPPPPALPAQSAGRRISGMPRMRDEPALPSGVLRRMRVPFLSSDIQESVDEPAPQSIERSQWERLSLGPNLELHVRRPLGRLEQKRVERLITIARQVLKEEQP